MQQIGSGDKITDFIFKFMIVEIMHLVCLRDMQKFSSSFYLCDLPLIEACYFCHCFRRMHIVL